MKINYANHLAQVPTKTVEIKTFLEQIRNPKDLIRKTIDQARMFSKESDSYAKLKKSLPCVYFNFLFNGEGMSDKNILNSTGLFYIDIDNVCNLYELKEKLKTIPFLFSYWESVSGKGISALLKVDGVDAGNYKEYAEFIKKSFNFDFDSACFSKSRKTFISYDENIYVNDKCEVLSYEKVLSTPLLITNNSIVYIEYNKREGKGVDDTSSKGVDDTLSHKIKKQFVRYSNKKDFSTEAAVEVYKDGIGIVDIQINIKYKNGRRNNGMMNDGIKFLFLNPHVDNLDDFKFHMHNLNKKKCIPNLTPKEIAIISANVFSQREVYKPKITKVKYVVNRDLIIDPRDAQSAVAKIINAEKRESTLNLLKSLYIEGMTQKYLMKESGMGIATIKRYWKDVVTN